MLIGHIISSGIDRCSSILILQQRRDVVIGTGQNIDGLEKGICEGLIIDHVENIFDGTGDGFAVRAGRSSRSSCQVGRQNGAGIYPFPMLLFSDVEEDLDQVSRRDLQIGGGMQP